MRKLILILILIVTLTPAIAQAQGSRLEWTQPNTTLAEASTPGNYTWKVDSNPAAVLVQTCVGGTPVTCSAPLTQAQAPPTGSHTYTLQFQTSLGSAPPVTVTGSAPTQPGPFRIITVTVTVQGVEEPDGWR